MNLQNLVIGFGSPHGDDAVGWLVSKALVPRLAEGARAVQAGDALEMMDELATSSRVWIVDGCCSGDPPGTIHRWQWPDIQLGRRSCRSTHALGVAEVLRLAEQLGCLPASVVVYGVEIADCSPQRENVSPPVLAAVSAIVEILLSEVGQECDSKAHSARIGAHQPLDEAQ